MKHLITGSTGTEQEERNRKAVLDFYHSVIIRREYERWPEFLHPDYRQHKPNVTDGPQGVLDFMRAAYARFPKHNVEVVRSFADGDFVMLHVHVHMQPVNNDIAVMDIFRCKDGMLLEHWDVEQDVPTEMAHANGMF
ncbi:MAG TPA: nuclear transport factor 2 family protein [Steroidobacteraceae bacterium]|nr:nuclear transport factor 2 family protein [Steroidobacteraceae bacterium]